jgi:deazaflavin-dependent oxidoreductase (nitroreductase family)
MPAVRRSPLLKLLWKVHPWLYQASNGRLGAKLLGNPVLLLTTTGRKSGLERTNTLYYFPDEDRYIVIASNAGYAKHPAWYLNLMAQPLARVQAGRIKVKVTGREAAGEEREALWAKVLAIDSSYAEYQGWTERQIPVVILEPSKENSAE